jgi:hypothetical protein
VTAENFYHANLTTTIWVNPGFADHDTGNVAFTVTDFGAFGYYDYLQGTFHGVGFRLPQAGSNALYQGSLMAGISESKVSDCAFGDLYGTRYDWAVVPGGEIVIAPNSAGAQEGRAIYKDSVPLPVEQVGLQVTQKSYSWSNSTDDDYVILSFTMKNISGGPLNNLHVGLFMDWEIAQYGANRAGWDPALELGYQYNPLTLSPNKRYYGLRLLTGPFASYRVINLPVDLAMYQYGSDYHMPDALKYQYMSQGPVQTVGPTNSDYAMIMSAGPFSVASGDSTLPIAFAVLGGENLSDLQANAVAAYNKWWNVPVVSSNRNQATFKITGASPQPANGDLNLSFTLPGSGQVNFDLIDVLGRATPVWEGYYQQAGSYRVVLPKRDLTSGVYLLRGTSPYGRAATKIVWLK